MIVSRKMSIADENIVGGEDGDGYFAVYIMEFRFAGVSCGDVESEG